MNRTIKFLSILIAIILMGILTSCSDGKTKVVEKTVTSIVYLDATTTTTEVAPPVIDERKYADTTFSAQLESDAYMFNASFPVFGYNDEVNTMDRAADANTTGSKWYYTGLNAALKDDEMIYCRSYSDACSLTADFEVEVYEDNAVNRTTLEIGPGWDCREMTFTGTPGTVCTLDSYYEGDETIRWMAQVSHNGYIYDIQARGTIPDRYLYYQFIESFGFNDV